MLSHYMKKGYLRRVRRGVYQAADYQNPSAFWWEALVMELGKIEIELEGSVVSIFDRELTIIDAFRLLNREIAIKALK